MATKLERPVTRVVIDVPHRGNLVVTLALEGIVFRYPRTRTRFTLPYGLGMLKAEQLAGDALRAEKKAKRKALRAGR